MSKKIDNKTYSKYFLQALNVDELKQICRDFNIKGFSKWKKVDLIENIIGILSDEELNAFLKDKEIEIISNSIDSAIKIIKGTGREKITEIRIVNEEDHLVELDFKGFNWDTSSYLSINPQNIDNPERDCDCRVGANMGFCNHFWVGFILSLKRNYFKLSDWTLTPVPDNFEDNVRTIEVSVISPQKSKAQKEVLTLIDSSSNQVQYIKYLDQSITIYEGIITKIEEKIQQFQEIETTYYLATLSNVKIGSRVKRKADFKEEEIETFGELNIRISDRLHDELKLKAGDKITVNGKLTRDDFLNLFVVKNIRKVTKINN